MFDKSRKYEKFKEKVWLASPTMHGEELQYMQEAFDTNWMSTIGVNINEVETQIAEKVGMDHAVALATGTASIHLSVKLAGEYLYGRGEMGKGALAGKRVFCSDMTFDATVNPIVYEGGIPVFIDTEYDTWNMDPAALEKAFELYPDVKLIDLAHLYGTPGKIDEIRAIAKNMMLRSLKMQLRVWEVHIKGSRQEVLVIMAVFHLMEIKSYAEVPEELF